MKRTNGDGVATCWSATRSERIWGISRRLSSWGKTDPRAAARRGPYARALRRLLDDGTLTYEALPLAYRRAVKQLLVAVLSRLAEAEPPAGVPAVGEAGA